MGHSCHPIRIPKINQTKQQTSSLFTIQTSAWVTLNKFCAASNSRFLFSVGLSEKYLFWANNKILIRSGEAIVYTNKLVSFFCFHMSNIWEFCRHWDKSKKSFDFIRIAEIEAKKQIFCDFSQETKFWFWPWWDFSSFLLIYRFWEILFINTRSMDDLKCVRK